MYLSSCSFHPQLSCFDPSTVLYFFFNDTATTEIYTLSLHDALPIFLCDIALPDGSGYDVIAEVKRKRPVKAVALTGFGAPDDIERGKEAGFDFHLTKPVDFHELRAVLGQIAA